MLDHQDKKKPEVIISIPNSFRRESLAMLFEDSGFAPIRCTDPTQAMRFFQQRCLQVAAIIFDADAFGPQFLESTILISDSAGYGFRPYLAGLSQDCNNPDLESNLRMHDAELRALERPLEIVSTVRALRRNLSKQPFRLVHYCDHDFGGRCVAGEVPLLEIRAKGRGIPLSESPLFFADAILKYSPEASPKPISSLLQIMAMDPFYMSALSEKTLTHRNFITNVYRIRQALFPILGSETDTLFVSCSMSSGKERGYHFRGRCVPEHVKIPPFLGRY